MKLLIVYATTEGQTKKIATFIAEKAREKGHQVVTHNAEGAELFPNGFQAAILMGSMHAGKYQTALKQYISLHSPILNDMPTFFVSVSLTAAGIDRAAWKELDAHTQTFLEDTHWQPDHVMQVAGALRYTQYNFLKKWLMRMIAKRNGGDTDTSRDYEYTDWDQVKALIPNIEHMVKESGNEASIANH